MKTITCNQLGGACDLAFHADTFESMAETLHITAPAQKAGLRTPQTHLCKPKVQFSE